MFKHIQLLAFALCALLVIPAAAQVPSYVPTDGLVGWWPFNGNANDESGNGNDGVVNGAVLSTDRFGNFNSAFDFDGLNDFITATNSASLQSPNTTITISAWFKIDDWDNNFNPFGYAALVSKSDINNCQYRVNVSTIDMSFVYNSANLKWTYPKNFIQLGVWNNVIVKFEQNISTFYFNGEAFLNDNDNSEPFGTSQNLDFGRDQIGGVDYFNGTLDDIAIYNRALTEQEIQNLYTGTTPPPCVSLPSNLQQGLVGYWPFCGNANDESGNGNDGMVNGATLTEDRFGNANAAYGFDGVDDFIEVDHSTSLSFANQLSVSFWMNSPDYTMGSLPGPERCPIGKQRQAGSGLVFETVDAVETCCGPQFYLNDDMTTLQYEDGEPLFINQWNQITGVYNGTDMSLYLNGNLIGTASDNLDLSSIDQALNFGREGSLNRYFKGSLDDIGIWNRALTPEEVQELYTLDTCTFTVYDTLTVYETVYDTVYTYETIYDTVTTYVTVTDTLLIDITFTGIEGQPSWLNTVTVFPNPASDHITIDYGNFALMAGYNTIITDAAGATVYSSAVNSQQVEIDINAWGAMGVYYMSVYDANGELVAVRHIVLE
jgi:hypothetical protein